MTIKTLYGFWKNRVPIEIQQHIEHQLNEMKRYVDPKRDMSRSAVICYFLVNYIREKVEDRVCRILLLIEVVECMKECGLGFDKKLYKEIENLVSICDEPVRNVLTNFLLEIKK